MENAVLADWDCSCGLGEQDVHLVIPVGSSVFLQRSEGVFLVLCFVLVGKHLLRELLVEDFLEEEEGALHVFLFHSLKVEVLQRLMPGGAKS